MALIAPLPTGMTAPAGATIDQGNGNSVTQSQTGGPTNSGPTNLQPGQVIPNPSNVPTTAANPGGGASYIMPPAVKNGLETTANAEGNAIGSGVPTTSQGPQSTSTVQPPATPNINDYLGALGPAPTAPNWNADQTTEENAVGISAIQTNISNLTTQLQSAQAQALTAEGAEASKPGVVASVINGRIKMISSEDAVAITNLQNQIKDAQSQLTAANTVVSTYMKNDRTSFTDASTAYEKAHTEAMAQYTDAEKQANLAQTTARANITALTASFKGKTGYTPTADDIANWNTLDLQAGFQPGTTAAIVQNDLNVSKFIKGSNGEEYAITTDANGNPQVVQIGYAGGTTAQANGKNGSSTTSTAAQLKQKLTEDTNAMSSALDAAKGTDGMVSDADWNQALHDWLAADSSHTTAQFNTAFKSYKSTNKP